MRKELRKNFGVVVKLLDRMQKSVLIENDSYFSSNQINFVRNIDMTCGKLGEAVDAIFEDCKDVVQSKEDVVMTMMEQDYDNLYRTFRDGKESKPRGLYFEFDCGEKEGRKIYDIIVRFDKLSDSSFVYVKRWYMKKDTYIPDSYYNCRSYDKQRYFKNWIYSWGEKKWVHIKRNGYYTYNSDYNSKEEPVLEEPVFKRIPLK